MAQSDKVEEMVFEARANEARLNAEIELEQLAADFLRDFPADQYPYLAEHIRQHAEPSDERPHVRVRARPRPGRA